MKVTFCVATCKVYDFPCRLIGSACVKACVGGLPHQPNWGWSRLSLPPWGNQTLPTIHWQQWLAGDISDSFGSAHSCRHRREFAVITDVVCTYCAWLKHFCHTGNYWHELKFGLSSYHLSMHFWQKLCAQGRMRSAFPSMQIQHSSSSVSCFTLHEHTNFFLNRLL